MPVKFVAGTTLRSLSTPGEVKEEKVADSSPAAAATGAAAATAADPEDDCEYR